MTDQVLFTDAGNEHKYFTTIPNLIDDLELSPYAVRLYLRLKRRAGESGTCWESTSNLAKACRIGTASVSRAKDELVKAGLICIETIKRPAGQFGYHSIKIIDIWPDNMKRYTACSSMEQVDLSPVPHMRLKNNPSLKVKSKKNKSAGVAANPTTSSEKTKNVFSSSVESEYSTSISGEFSNANPEKTSKRIQKHPAIELIKRVTGYYPRKNLWDRIIKLLGVSPDEVMEANVKIAFDTWTANGYSPTNLMGWLFDWYAHNLYYVLPQKKFEDQLTGQPEL